MKKNILIQLCVFTLILIAYSEALHLKDLYRKLFHHDYERKFSAPQSNYHDEIRQFKRNDNTAVAKPRSDFLRDGTSPLVRNDGTSTEIDEYENHAIAKRSKAKVFGTLFKWSIIGGGVLGGLSMATAFARLGFDAYFQTRGECCGLHCCGNLCDDKDEFDRLKTALFNNSDLVDQEWIKIEKQHNYIKNLDSGLKTLQIEVDRFDTTVFQFVSTLTSKSLNELLDIVSKQGEEIKKLNTTRQNITEREIEDIFFMGIFSHWETEAFRWTSILGDAVSIYSAVKQFKKFSIADFTKKFYAGTFKYSTVKMNHLETNGYKWKNKAAANLKVSGVFLKNNWWSISKGLFSLGVNVFSVYASVQDILYMAQVVDECKDLRDRVEKAVDEIRPEVAEAERILGNCKETLTNVSTQYRNLADATKATEFLNFVEQVTKLAENSSRSTTYTTEIANLKTFRRKIVLAPTEIELEINLIPSLIAALRNITDQYSCLDRKFSILKKGTNLCSNSNNTMYVFGDIWPIVVKEETLVYKEDNCIATTYLTQSQFAQFVKMKMADYGHQEDCFLNSAIAWGRVCTEWRKNVTDAQIKTNLLTDTISPITFITQSRVDFFLNKGCNKNSLTTNNKNTICSEKATFLTKALMLKFWNRWDTTELTTHYDSCALVDQTLLVNAICNNKATDKTMDLTNSHKVTPMDRYSLAMFKTQYDACALTDALKDEICFLKDDLYFYLEEVMLEPIIKHYPQSLVEAGYNGCVKVMDDATKIKICRLKSRGCQRKGCALSDPEYDQYRKDFGAAAVKSAYEACAKKDEKSIISKLFDMLQEE